MADKRLLAGALIVVAIALLAFASLNQPSISAAFSLQPKDTLLIGAALSLTGKASSYGVDIKNGIEFALEDIQKSGEPLNVRVLFDDTASAPEKAVTSVQKFIQVDGAKAIVTLGADETLAVVPVTEASKVILFTPIAGSDKVDGSGEYVFRNREPSKLTAYALADLLSSRGYKETALFVAKASSSAASYEKSFLERFSSFGGKVVFTFYYDETQPDARIGIANAKEADIKAVYVIASKDKDGSEVVKQLKEMGFDGLVVGGPALDTEKFFEVTQQASEGVIISISMIDKNAPNAERILADYKSKYGKEMSQWAANAYDMVNLLNDSAQKCGSDTNCIRDYLHSVKDWPGLGGKTTFNAEGGVTKPMYYKIARDGKFVPYEAN